MLILCSPRWLLKQEVPKIVKSINRQLREKSIKTKVRIVDIFCGLLVLWSLLYKCLICLQVGAFSVLRELVVVLPDCLADHIGSLIPGIEKALNVSEILSSWRWIILCKYLSGSGVLILFISDIVWNSGQIFNIKFENWSPNLYSISFGFPFPFCFPSIHQGKLLQLSYNFHPVFHPWIGQ